MACALSHQYLPLANKVRNIEGLDVAAHDAEVRVDCAQIARMFGTMNDDDKWPALRTKLEQRTADFQRKIKDDEVAEVERKHRREMAHINAHQQPIHRALFLDVQGGIAVPPERLARDWLGWLPAGVDVKLSTRGEIVITGSLPPAHADALERLGPAIVAELRRREPPVTIHKVAAGAAR